MPVYKKIVAQNLKEARQRAYREFGLNCTIIREKVIKKRSWRWLGMVSTCYHELLISQYKGRRNKKEAMNIKGIEKQPLPMESMREQPGLAEDSEASLAKSLDYVSNLIKNEERKNIRKQRAEKKKSEEFSFFSYAKPAKEKNSEHQRLLSMISEKEKIFAHQANFARSSSRKSSMKAAGYALKLKPKPAEPIRDTLYAQRYAPVLFKKEENLVSAFLKKEGFQPDFIKDILSSFSKSHLSSKADFEELMSSVVEFISFAGKTKLASKGAKLVFFIGATGVGKTTTLSKIVADFHFEKEAKEAVVAIGSFDFRRLAAMEQIASFTKILDIPFFRLNDEQDLLKMLSAQSKKKIYFIDTPGSGRNEEALLQEIAGLIHCVNLPKEVHLCIDASMRFQQMLLSMNTFEALGFDRLLFTKQDESLSLGRALSLARHANMPFSYFSHGQDIPQDITLADAASLKNILRKEWLTDENIALFKGKAVLKKSKVFRKSKVLAKK